MLVRLNLTRTLTLTLTPPYLKHRGNVGDRNGGECTANLWVRTGLGLVLGSMVRGRGRGGEIRVRVIVRVQTEFFGACVTRRESIILFVIFSFSFSFFVCGEGQELGLGSKDKGVRSKDNVC